MLLTKEVNMNLNYRGVPVVLDVLQGDSARALRIRFAAGENAWEIPADAQIVVQYQCQDGSGGVFDSQSDGMCAYSVDGDTLTLSLPSALCAVPGNTDLQISILSEGQQISTFPIKLQVSPQVNAAIAAGDYMNLQQWLERQLVQEQIVEKVLAALPNGDEVAY